MVLADSRNNSGPAQKADVCPGEAEFFVERVVNHDDWLLSEGSVDVPVKGSELEGFSVFGGFAPGLENVKGGKLLRTCCSGLWSTRRLSGFL